MNRKELFEELDERINELDALYLSAESKLQDIKLKARILLECKINRVLVSGIVNDTIKFDYGYEGFKHGYFYYVEEVSGFVILGDRLKDIDRMALFMNSVTRGHVLIKHPDPVNFDIIGKIFEFEGSKYAAEYIYRDLISTGEKQYMCRNIRNSTIQPNFKWFVEHEIVKILLESNQLPNKKHLPFEGGIKSFSKAGRDMWGIN